MVKTFNGVMADDKIRFRPPIATERNKMTFTLYDATVANYLQTLGAVAHILEKGHKHFSETGKDTAEGVMARLAPDMLPLWFQIVSVTHHSRGAIEGAGKGLFEPPPRKSDFTYAELQRLVTDARSELSALTPEVVNALVGRDVIFKSGDLALPFKAEGFLMSFSLPNFYFHAATTYGILRHMGVTLGKRDFMGKMNMSAR